MCSPLFPCSIFFVFRFTFKAYRLTKGHVKLIIYYIILYKFPGRMHCFGQRLNVFIRVNVYFKMMTTILLYDRVHFYHHRNINIFFCNIIILLYFFLKTIFLIKIIAGIFWCTFYKKLYFPVI